MPLQADSVAFRWTRVATAAGARSSPTDGDPNSAGGGTPPDFTMSPGTVSEMPTTGLALMLKVPSSGSAIPNAGGFTVTVWLRDPHTYGWAAFAPVTIDYSQLFVTFDIDAGEIYFQIGAVAVDGNIDIGIAEQ